LHRRHRQLIAPVQKLAELGAAHPGNGTDRMSPRYELFKLLKSHDVGVAVEPPACVPLWDYR